MAPPTTVMEFRTNDKAGREVAVLALQQALVTVDASLAALRADVAGATNALADLQATESQLRQQIAHAAMPAEAAALVDILETNLMDQRVAAATLAGKQDGLARAEAERTRTGALLDLERARLAQATADLALAAAADAQLVQWRAVLGGPALAAAIADSNSPATASLVAAATTRLENLLGGSELLDLLQKRHADAVSALGEPAAAANRQIDALDALRVSQSAVDGAVVATATAFGRATDAVRTVTDSAGQRLAAARTALQVASGAANLPAEDAARIGARATTARTAAGREGAIHDARVTERTKLAALEVRALPQEAADPTFDRTTIAPEHADWLAAKTAREDAERPAQFSATMKANLDKWEVSLPPALLTAASGDVRAAAAIAELRGTDPAALAAALVAAEQAYAAALDARSAAGHRLEVTGQLVAARLDEVAAVARVRDARLAALVRGDA